MWLHEMTPEQKTEYGFVKISSCPTLEKVKESRQLLNSKICESCGDEGDTTDLEKLNPLNQKPTRQFALLCKNCRAVNKVGKPLGKRWNNG